MIASSHQQHPEPQNTPTRRPHPGNLTSRNHNKNTRNTNIHATAGSPPGVAAALASDRSRRVRLSTPRWLRLEAMSCEPDAAPRRGRRRRDSQRADALSRRF